MKNFGLKRAFSVVMALLLLLPAFAMLTLATSVSATPEVEREIISHPTFSNPTVTVSDKNGASYQWYYLTSLNYSIGTEHVAQAFGSFDGSCWSHGDASTSDPLFTIYLEASTTVYFSYSYLDYGIYAQDENGYAIDFAYDGNWLIGSTEQSSLYSFYAPTEGVQVEFNVSTNEYVPIEGQTGKTLTDYTIDTVYLVKISYEDGEVLESDSFSASFYMRSAPTEANPTVEVTFEDQTTFQWFVLNRETDEYEPIEGQTTKTLTEYTIGKTYRVEALCMDKYWICSDPLKMGYLITSQPSKDSPYVETNADSDVTEYKWYKIVTSGNPYAVTPLAPDTSVDVTLYQGVCSNGKWSSNDGYINIALSAKEHDVIIVKTPPSLACEVDLYGSYDRAFTDMGNGVYAYTAKGYDQFVDFEIRSDYIISDVEIYLERSAEGMPVTYSSKISEESGKIYADEFYGGYEENGSWIIKDDYAEIYVYIDLKNPQIVLSGTEGVTFEVYNDSYNTNADISENGVSTVSCGLYSIYVYSQTPDDYAQISILSDGKTYTLCADSFWDDENGILYTYDVNDGYLENGRWYSDGEYNEIDIELDLTAGSILKVEVDSDFDGMVILDGNDKEIELERIGNLYVYASTDYFSFDLEIFRNDEKPFSAVITAQRGEITPFESASTKEAPTEGGFYLAELTFTDGTKKRTSAIYNEEQPCCDGDEEDNNGNTGLVVIIICSAIVLIALGVAAFLIIKKKRFSIK